MTDNQQSHTVAAIVLGEYDADTVTVTTTENETMRIHRDDADPEHRHLEYRLAAAWFSNPPAPQPLLVAVIEWPEAHGAAPSVRVSRSQDELDVLVRTAVREYADALSYPDWRDAIAAAGGDDLDVWVTHMDLEVGETPVISYHTKEI